MKILVLGGTGAIGKAVVDILSKQHKVFVTSRQDNKEEINVKYYKGNAHDMTFLIKILDNSYDVIIDFMMYSTAEFKERFELLLNSTDHYFFLSSSRIYANKENDAIVETDKKLIEVINDKDYIKSNDYPLEKARQELILTESSYSNWTIIRPYITYNDNRLQLGIFEKEQWLFRVLNGKSMYFTKDIGEKITTLTYGYDVAYIMSFLVENKLGKKEAIHITQNDTIKWREVAYLYKNILEKKLNKKINFLYEENMNDLNVYINQESVKYDRLYNRKFNNNKILNLINEYSFMDTKIGLEKCLETFLNSNIEFRNIDWVLEALIDKRTHDKQNIAYIKGIKSKIKYLLVRYTSIYFFISKALKKIRDM